MLRDPTKLEGTEFDLVVIGGGMFGAAATLDAAQRGLRVALVERADFGGATSSHSFKMVHGGIRYLQHADVARLRHSARARLTAKDWDGAVQQFKRCLEVQPECPDACFGLAYVCNQTGDIPGALKWIEQAENGSLTLQKAWENQKTSLFKSSQEERMRLFKLAEDLLNNGMYTYSCKSQKLLTESTQATQKARAITADADAGDSPFAIPAEYHSLHGNLLFKLKRLPEAECAIFAGAGHRSRP